MKYLSILFLAAVMMACSANDSTNYDTETEATTVDAPERNAYPEDTPPTLDATVAAIRDNEGDLTAVKPSNAAALISYWQGALKDVDGADKVVYNLEALQDELRTTDINGPLAGILMVTLAEDTREVAGSAPFINELITGLYEGGMKLTKSATEGSDLLSQTLAAAVAVKGDITTLAVGTARTNIESWIEKLDGMDGTADIVTDLRALHEELGQENIDGEKAAMLLKSMSESTAPLAEENKSLRVLAYALDAGYWRLKSAD